MSTDAALDPEDALQQQEGDHGNDEDNLSITSTDVGENDADKEWEVEDVLAERQHPDDPDARQYLIRWDGFALEHSTWEPVENLGDGLLVTWEERKAEIEAGSRDSFDLATYDAACAGRNARHQRRNAKRQRLGLPQTPPFHPGHVIEPLVASPEELLFCSSDEAEEVNEIADDVENISIALPNVEVIAKPAPPSTTTTPTATDIPSDIPITATTSTAAATTRKPAKQTTFIGIPTPAPPKDASISQRPRNERDQRSSLPPLKTSAKASTLNPSPLTKPSPVRKSPGGTMTGYQGTARKSSIFRPPTSKVSAQTAVATKSPSSAGKALLSSSTVNTFKAKRLTATRTQPLPASSAPLPPNVFAGGKQHKKRANLADVMGDTSRAPKAFSNMRIMNIAKKRGIEKGDAVGALSSIPSKFIIGNESANTRRNLDPSNRLSISPTTAQNPPAPSEVANQNISDVSTLKRKKTVHFTGDDNNDTTSLVTPTATNTADINMETSPSHEPPNVDKDILSPARKLSLATYQERGQLQSIQKLVKFGSSEQILVGFDGISRHAAPWLSAFKDEKILHFKSTCTAFHFLSQTHQLIGEKLSAGTVEAISPEHSTALENVAISLQRGSMGLHIVTREYSILIYPTASAAWSALDVGTIQHHTGIALQHFIYRSPITLQVYPSECDGPGSTDGPEPIGSLTGLNFSEILPQDLRQKDRQAYMLLIPLKATHLLGVVMAWLRFHQPDRPIFNLEQPDSWRLFHEAVNGGAGGTIICHADFVLWKLEKVSGFWRMLEGQRYTFWHLDTGENKQPQYPSRLDAVSIPGTLHMTRLFPYGRAFLITPSFVLSEPTKLYEFLKWFRLYVANPGHIIVTCHDFPRYLRNITDEKQEEHSIIKRLNPDNKNVNKFLERTGRGKNDVGDHHRACQLLQEIMELYGDDETSEDIRKIQWLSESIDPNDEQSLVNAFCWWTQLRCDRFRRFYVLGSDPKQIHRAYRYIEIPRYRETEGSDPDATSILAQRRLSTVEHHENRSSVCETPFSFPGSLFRTDDANELQAWVDGYRRRNPYNWCVLHEKPVSWRDKKMAAQFGDVNDQRMQFDTFEGWFKSAPKFTKKQNTWVGLFYTITDTWDERMPKQKYERHPWIAVYRPRNPHMMPAAGEFNKIDLFIWDVATADRGRFGHSLLDMQCQLIDYVYRTVGEWYPDCSLASVWYGNTTKFQIYPEDNPLDITRRKVEEFFDQYTTSLPTKGAYLHQMWTQINWRLWNSGMSSMTLRTGPRPTNKRISQTEKDKHKSERMIWHPIPRGIVGHGTKCLNDLHEACLEARFQDPACNDLRYQYRPTQEWWADQIEEGRDYGYIRVDVGSKIVDKLPKSE